MTSDTYEIYRSLMEQASQVDEARQVSLLEQAISVADSLGDQEAGARARQELISALAFLGETEKIFVPFGWVLQRYQARPVWFDEEMQHRTLWQHKWIVDDLMDFPQVPLKQLEDSLAQMYMIYREAGEDLGPVHSRAYSLARHVRGVGGAHREFADWSRSPRTDLSDCQACEATTRAQYYTDTRQWQQAIDEIEPVLSGQLTCREQPQLALTTAMEPLLMVGRDEDARAAHYRAWRVYRDQPGHVYSVATHLEVLTRSGAVDRALELLATRLADLEDSGNPLNQMRLNAVATRLLDVAVNEYGKAGQLLGTQTIDELRPVVRQRAFEMARRFDERNQTPAIGQWVAQMVQAPYLPPMPLFTVAAAAPAEPVMTPSERPHAPSLEGLDQISVEELSARAEAAVRYGSHDECTTIADAWRRRRGELDQLPADAPPALLRAVAELEYQLAWSDLDVTVAQAQQPIASAAALFRRAGDPGEALIAEQWLAARDGALEFDDFVARIDEVGTPAQRARARMRALASVGADVVGGYIDDILALDVGPDSDPLLRRSWAMANVAARDSVEPPAARVEQSLALLGDDEFLDAQVALWLQVAQLSFDEEDPDPARVALATAEHVARRAGEGRSLAHVMLTAGQLDMAVGDFPAAEQHFRRSAAVADQVGSWEQSVEAKGLLSDILRGQGRLIEAAEMAEAALAALDGARAAGKHWDSDNDRRLGWILHSAAMAAAALEENERAIGLYRRWGDFAQEHGSIAAVGHANGQIADLMADSDAVGAVTHYRRGIAAAEEADDQRELMVLRRNIIPAVFEADGLEMALAEVDAAVDLNDTNEARVLTDSDLAEQLDGWDFAWERLELAERRARLYGMSERFAEALAILGDIPEQMAALDQDYNAVQSRIFRARLLIGADQLYEGLGQLEYVISKLRAWGDNDSAIVQVTAIGYRALTAAGQEEEAEAFWNRHVPQ